VLYYFHCGKTGRRPYAIRYSVSLPTNPFISVPFLPFHYFSSSSKGKRNRQFSFVLQRSHEREEKDEKELEEEARDVVDTLVEGAGVFLIRTKHFCIFANLFHPAEQIHHHRVGGLKAHKFLSHPPLSPVEKHDGISFENYMIFISFQL
jgi:hypothetical protein